MLKLILANMIFFFKTKLVSCRVAPQENDARFAIHPQGMIL